MKPMAKQTETKDITIKEAANELHISESTVKKYLKDFDLPSSGNGGKATLTKETFQALQEIAKLRTNGLSIQEIKELKSQKPTKTVLDEIEETVDLKEKPEEKVGEETEEKSEEKPSEEIEAELESDLKEDLEDSADISPEASEVSSEDRGPSATNGQRNEQAPRRRGFNYRYVERQISMDSKKVSSLRQHLRNPNLSVHDKLFFEESLERRILFLNGWKHILRWIAK